MSHSSTHVTHGDSVVANASHSPRKEGGVTP